jgi:hypothetical protein
MGQTVDRGASAMTRHFYAAENSYGSATSFGFANTWYAIRFDSRQERDEWVSRQNTLTAEKCSAKAARKLGVSMAVHNGQMYHVDGDVEYEVWHRHPSDDLVALP